MIGSLPPSVALAALLEALESAGLGCTVVLDRPDGVERVYANEAIARIFGVDVETMRAMPAMDVLPPGERARMVTLRDSLGPGRPGPLFIETSIVRADGRAVPVEIGLGYGLVDGIRAAFVFMRDVTKKASLAAALRESEDRFRRVAEACPDAISIIANGKYVYANPSALRHIGVTTLDQLAHVDPQSLVPPEQLAHVRERGRRLFQGETVPPFEVRVPGPGGKDVILESSLILSSKDGEHALISYARDITDRVHLQAELMKQDRLASVGILAAGVAHELNNPLMSLGMQVRQLQKDADAHGLSGEVRHVLDGMNEATKRMQVIISDLLFMSRPVDKPQTHVDVNQIIASTVELLRAGTPGCPPIEVALDELPPIRGYASKLGQIFLNLLRNAVQAVEGDPKGEVRVRAHASGDAIAVIIADNGPGVPRELLSRIAQPFFTTKPHGTGLGLWISQTLVAQHGGKMDLTTVEGEGTTVTVSLPQTFDTPRPA